ALLSSSSLFFLAFRRPPRPTPFPYTTLFRSQAGAAHHLHHLGQARGAVLGELVGCVLGAQQGDGAAQFAQRFAAGGGDGGDGLRSEEHTSELQSRENLVCRLLLEKKKATEGA